MTRRRLHHRTALAATGVCLVISLLAPTPARGDGEPGDRAPAGEHHANRLAGESSPYLLLHAGDPVDWYPWGSEAFERARKEDKPIFLSIGYSSCYWCHVMAREVFSDPEIAALMNRWFVNVKVDREERPDVDEVYVTAAQVLAGSAGWPASLFLTPSLEPFFASSYLPPEDRDGRAGLPTVARRVHEGWTGERRPELEELARRVTAVVGEALGGRQAPAGSVPPASAADAAVAAVREGFDTEWGGFAPAPAYRPKFPRPGDLFLLIEAWDRGDEAAGKMVVEGLRAMGRGAIHDQLGGGFHRYTLDREWRVPHFEKMLYDNALLGEVLAEVERRRADPELEQLGRATLDFLLERMALPSGGFLSSFDAETDAGEGAYYTWTGAEIRAVVGEEGFSELAPSLGLDDDEGELPGGRHTLYWTAPPLPLRERLEPLLAKLRATRETRPAPRADDKVLTDWNGMAVAALARGGAVYGEPRYLEAARRAAEHLLSRSRGEDGTLRHSWRDGRATVPAFLDDYAFLIHGLLALADAEPAEGAAGEGAKPTQVGRRWTAAAEALTAELGERLGDPDGGYEFAAGDGHLPLRTRTAIGRATPAGNAVAILDLLDLAGRTGEAAYRERAAAALRAFAHELADYPQATPDLALALLRYHGVAPASPANGEKAGATGGSSAAPGGALR